MKTPLYDALPKYCILDAHSASKRLLGPWGCLEALESTLLLSTFTTFKQGCGILQGHEKGAASAAISTQQILREFGGCAHLAYFALSFLKTS